MSHGSQAPENHCQGVAEACAHTIHHPADRDHAHGVSRLKSKHKIAVVNFVPAEIVLQGALENSEDLAIHVVLGSA